MEWLLDEPEELARLTHYTYTDDALANNWSARGADTVRGWVFPGFARGERVYLLVPSVATAQRFLPSAEFDEQWNSAQRDAGLTGRYPARRTFATRVRAVT